MGLCIVGVTLLTFNFREKRKQTKLMEQIFQYYATNGGDEMDIDMKNLMGGEDVANKPIHNSSLRSDMASTMKAFLDVNTSLTGHMNRAAFLHSAQDQLRSTNKQNQQAKEFVEVLSEKVRTQNEESSTVALGNEEPTAISQTRDDETKSPQEASSAPVQEVSQEDGGTTSTAAESEDDEPKVSTGADTPPEDEIPFTIDDLRQVIRDNECLRFAYHASSPGQNISSEFQLRPHDVRNLTNALEAKEKKGKIADIINGERALKFLREYNPEQWSSGIIESPSKY